MDISYFEAKVALGESLSLKEQQTLLEEIARLQRDQEEAEKDINLVNNAGGLEQIRATLEELKWRASDIESTASEIEDGIRELCSQLRGIK